MFCEGQVCKQTFQRAWSVSSCRVHMWQWLNAELYSRINRCWSVLVWWMGPCGQKGVTHPVPEAIWIVRKLLSFNKPVQWLWCFPSKFSTSPYFQKYLEAFWAHHWHTNEQVLIPVFQVYWGKWRKQTVWTVVRSIGSCESSGGANLTSGDGLVVAGVWGISGGDP